MGILDIDVPMTDLFLRKYTQQHLITHKKTFTPYDMYDLEKSVTIRNPANLGSPGSEKGHVWREMRHVLRTREQEEKNT